MHVENGSLVDEDEAAEVDPDDDGDDDPEDVNGVNGAQEETSSSLKATPPRKRSLMDTIAKLSGSAAKNKVQVCGP